MLPSGPLSGRSHTGSSDILYYKTEAAYARARKGLRPPGHGKSTRVLTEALVIRSPTVVGPADQFCLRSALIRAPLGSVKGQAKALEGGIWSSGQGHAGVLPFQARLLDGSHWALSLREPGQDMGQEAPTAGAGRAPNTH